MPTDPTIAAAVAAVLAERPEVLGAYLFGSRVSGDTHPRSDVDVGVLGKGRLGLQALVELEDALERRLASSVDVVDLSAANAFLALEAVRGERIFERDPLALDLFDLYVLRRAGDLAFFERQRRRQLLGYPS